MNVTQRISETVDEGMVAFFEVVAKKFPEANQGDLSPIALFAFEVACEMVMRKWLEANAPALLAFEESSETNR